MTDILEQITKVRQKLRRLTIEGTLNQKPFATGMYRFSMFMISYYSRVSHDLKYALERTTFPLNQFYVVVVTLFTRICRFQGPCS